MSKVNAKKGVTTRAIVTAVIASFGLLALFIAFWIWLASGGIFALERFDSAGWLQPTNKETSQTCYRGGMARDITKRLLKSGMTSKDVEALLGKPDRANRLEYEYTYTLGMCSALQMDYDALHVYFDQQWRVRRTAILQH